MRVVRVLWSVLRLVLNLMKLWSVLRLVLNLMMVMNMKMRKNLHELEKLSFKKIFFRVLAKMRVRV